MSATDRVQNKPLPDDRNVIAWERQMARLVGRRDQPMTYLVLSVRRYPDWQQPLTPNCGINCSPLRKYRPGVIKVMARHHYRVGMMLRVIAGELGCRLDGGGGRPMIVHGEDFACRWLLDSRFRPDLWVFDQPIIRYGEVEDEWADLLSIPGILRNSDYPGMKWWPLAGTLVAERPIRKEDLIAAHIPAAAPGASRIGWWNTHERHPVKPLIDQIDLAGHVARLAM